MIGIDKGARLFVPLPAGWIQVHLFHLLFGVHLLAAIEPRKLGPPRTFLRDQYSRRQPRRCQGEQRTDGRRRRFRLLLAQPPTALF